MLSIDESQARLSSYSIGSITADQRSFSPNVLQVQTFKLFRLSGPISIYSTYTIFILCFTFVAQNWFLLLAPYAYINNRIIGLHAYMAMTTQNKLLFQKFGIKMSNYKYSNT